MPEKILVPVAQDLVARVRRAAAAARLSAGVVDEEEALRVGDGKGLQQHRVDQGEDGGIRAEAKREGKDRNRREAGVLAEGSEGVAQILHRGFEERAGAGFADTLFDAAGIVEGKAGRAAGFAGSQTLADAALLDGAVIGADFFVEVGFHAVRMAEALPQTFQRHTSSARTWLTAAVMRRQLRFSSLNWRRPAGVRA